MRKRVLLIAFAVLLLGASNAGAVVKQVTGAEVSATQANTSTTFTATVETVTIYNSGANEVFFALGRAATTSDAELPVGASLTVDNLDPYLSTSGLIVGVICSTGETATVYLYAAVH